MDDDKLTQAERKALGPFVALLLSLAWWGLGFVAVMSNHGLLFIAFNLLLLAALVGWASKYRVTK